MKPKRLHYRLEVLLILVTILKLSNTVLADKIMSVPMFGQRWSTWSTDQLGTCSNITLGGYGCGVTSISMIFKFYGINTDHRDMNTYLENNIWYANGCYVKWDIAANRSGGTIKWIGSFSYTNIPADLTKIKAELDAGYPVIGEVRLSGQQHFVVITGYSGSTYYINDP